MGASASVNIQSNSGDHYQLLMAQTEQHQQQKHPVESEEECAAKKVKDRSKFSSSSPQLPAQ